MRFVRSEEALSIVEWKIIFLTHSLLNIVCCQLFMSAVLLSAVEGIDIKCTVQEWSGRFPLGNECYSHSLQFDVEITTPNETITSISDETADHYQNQKKITALNFINQTINYMPQGFENFFKEISGITIRRSKLKAITNQNLKPFKHLVELYVDQNEIKSIDSDVFKTNLKLRNVNFEGNQLEALHGDLFKFNSYLKYINFENNKLKFIGAKIFYHNVRLDEACLRGNVCIDRTEKFNSNIPTMMTEIARNCGNAA